MASTIEYADVVANKDIIWNKMLASLKPSIRQSGIYDVDRWEPGTGDTREYSELDSEEYARVVDEDDDAEVFRSQQGYSKTVSPQVYGLDAKITRNLRVRGKYPEIKRRLTNAAKVALNRLDLDATHRLTFGTATSYTDIDGRSITITVGDGLALFSTAHTLRGSSSTYRNRLANNPRLSKGSLELMERMKVENTLNQFGEKMTMDFDILWTSDDPNVVNTARELLQSTAETSAPNAGVKNVYMAKYRHVILYRLATTAAGAIDTDKRYYWGLASSSNQDGHLSIEEEPNMTAPSPGANSEEFSSQTWFFRSRVSFALCWVGGRSIAFSSGDGTA